MYPVSLIASLLLCGLCAAAPASGGEYSEPSNPKHFTAYNTLQPGTICALATGPDGETLYFFDATNSKIGSLDTSTGAVREYAVHGKSSGSSSEQPICVVTTGKDDMVYFASSTLEGLYQLNPKTNPPKLTSFGTVVGSYGWAADQGIFLSDTSANLVYLFNYETHVFTTYPVTGPAGMRTDANNNLRVTALAGQYIAEISNGTGIVTEYTSCCLLPGDGADFPTTLAASTDNEEYLWALTSAAESFIRIEPATKSFTTVGLPGAFGLYTNNAEANDYCGRIWLSTGDQAVYYDTNKDTRTTVIIPEDSSVPQNYIAINRGPGHYMWFAGGPGTEIIRYALNPSCRGEPDK